jgi:hypothetical protein
LSFACVPASVERLAVQRRGRRTSGSLMLLQFPCGDCVRCNGLLGGAFSRRSRPDPAPNRRRGAIASFTSESTSFHRDGIVHFTSLPVRHAPSLPWPPNSPTTLHHRRPNSINFPVLFGATSRCPTTTAQRFAVKLQAAVRGRLTVSRFIGLLATIIRQARCLSEAWSDLTPGP